MADEVVFGEVDAPDSPDAMQIKQLLAPWRAVVGMVFAVFLRPTTVKRWEDAKEGLAFGIVVGVGETMICVAINFSGVLICIDL